MIGRSGDVSADTALGIAVAVSLLDMRPAQSVRVIRAPDLRKEAQYPEICPVAARSAALKEDMREPLA